MKKIQETIFSFSPLILFATSNLIITKIRPVYGLKKFGIISDILGWLPNFVSSFGFMLLGIVIFKISFQIRKKNWSKKNGIIFSTIWTIICLLGFTINEFSQKGTKLYFDVNDIFATIASTFLGSIIAYRQLINVKQIQHQKT